MAKPMYSLSINHSLFRHNRSIEVLTKKLCYRRDDRAMRAI